MYHKNPIAFKFYVVIVYITAHGGMKFIAVKDSFFKAYMFCIQNIYALKRAVIAIA